MLIVGAKGFAKEVLQVIKDNGFSKEIAFFDEVNTLFSGFLFDEFPVLQNEKEVAVFFENNGNEFTIGVGTPFLRYQLYEKFIAFGGVYISTISPFTKIGTYDVTIGKGSNVLSQAVFSNSSTIGMGCIVYYNVIITHDCVVGDFVQLSPGATLLGRCSIGSFSQIGANAIVFPDVKIGENVIVGAGTLVNMDIPNNSVVVGSPAKIIKSIAPLNNIQL